MTKKERSLRLELAYELIERVHSDLCRGDENDREVAQAPEFMEIFKQIIYLSKKVEQEVPLVIPPAQKWLEQVARSQDLVQKAVDDLYAAEVRRQKAERGVAR